MTTLTIKDLSVAAADLDSRAMSSVRGGTKGYGLFAPAPFIDASKFSANTQIDQYAQMSQVTSAPVGVDAALLDHVKGGSVTPYQTNYSNANVTINR